MTSVGRAHEREMSKMIDKDRELSKAILGRRMGEAGRVSPTRQVEFAHSMRGRFVVHRDADMSRG